MTKEKHTRILQTYCSVLLFSRLFCSTPQLGRGRDDGFSEVGRFSEDGVAREAQRHQPRQRGDHLHGADRQTDRRTDRQTDRQTDRLIKQWHPARTPVRRGLSALEEKWLPHY